MKRKATAIWQGTGKDGKGHLSTQSGALRETQYSASARFEDGVGTNPEELIAAAHSGCFTMKLAFNLANAGFHPERLETQAVVTLESGTVISSELTLNATVSGIDAGKFEELLRDAEKNCPISKLLNTKVTAEYTLNE